MPQYQCFHQVIDSDLELPELQLNSSPASPSIFIKLATVQPLADPIFAKPYYQINSTDYFIEVSGIAKFRVQNGTSIHIEADSGANPLELRLILFSRIMAVLLHQQKHLPLHGCSLVDGEKGTVITGKTTWARSILAAKLQEEQEPVGSAYLTALTDSGKVLTGYNQLECSPLTQKAPADVKKIIVLKPSAVKDPAWRQLKGLEKVQVLLLNTYYPEMLHDMEAKAAHFKLCNAISKELIVEEISIPQLAYSHSRIFSFIQTKLSYD